LIYHADLAKLPAILAHLVAVIPPDFGVLLVTPIGFLPLLSPTLVAAFLTAIGLSPIARPTDKKTSLSNPLTGKTTVETKLRSPSPSGAEWTMAVARGKLGFTILWAGSSRGHHKQKPRPF
jgi:hypothetical protein